MTTDPDALLRGEILGEKPELTVEQLCEACQVSSERIVLMVNEGLIEPRGQRTDNWRFSAVSIFRINCAKRLERDLGINTAGAALALDLLEEVKTLRERLRRFET